MLKTLVTKVIGTRFERELKRIQPIIDAIHEHETRLGALSDEEIQAQTAKLRDLLQERLGELRGRLAEKRQARHDCPDPDERDALNREVNDLETELKKQTAAALDELLPEAFATVREACDVPRDGVGHGAVRCPAHRRPRAAPGEDRRDGHR